MRPIGAATPLLVPSFSSRGFPDLDALFARVRASLRGSTLVSAYDLHHGALARSALDATEVVVLDSGGYEARAAGDLSEPYLDERRARPWDRAMYAGVLDALPESGLFLTVSFDTVGPFEEQVALAAQDFDGRPHATGFLCKPETSAARWLDTDVILRDVGRLASFSVLGVTEKELGPSPLERCRALRRLRAGLTAAGLDTPVHVFGCITPLAAAAYFLCGADIFDGLAWLRYAFGALPCYGAEAAIADGSACIEDDARQERQWVANLALLDRVQRALRRYGETGDPSVWSAVPALAAHQTKVLELVRAAVS